MMRALWTLMHLQLPEGRFSSNTDVDPKFSAGSVSEGQAK